MSSKPKNELSSAKGPATRPSKPPKAPQVAPTVPAPPAKRSLSGNAPARAKSQDAPPKRSNTARTKSQDAPPNRTNTQPGTQKRAREKQHSYYLECNQIAQPFAVRRTDSVREVDAALVSAISEPSNVLQSIAPAERTWESVRARMTSGLMRPRPAPPKARVDQLVVKHSKWFVNFGQYKDMPGRVRDWFAKTLGDPDIVAARADVDLNSIAAVASHAGRVTAASLIFKKERKEKQLVDVGVIRYPDPKQPYVKAYRIELTAWYESTIIFGYTFDTNGVKATINVEEFETSGTVAPSRRPTDSQFAAAQVDALFA